MFKILKVTKTALIIVFIFCIFCVNNVLAYGPDPQKSYILILPYLSNTAVSNGETLYIKADVKSNFPIIKGVVKIEGIAENIQFKLKEGTDLSGFWIAEWKGSGLKDKNYKVFVTFIDSKGHSYTPNYIEFSDPIAGLDELGNSNEHLFGQIYASKVTATTKIELINSIKLYSGKGKFRVALYNNLFELLWQSNDIENLNADWIEVLIKNGVPKKLEDLTSGDYWIAIQSNNTDQIFSLHTNENSKSNYGLTLKYIYNSFPKKLNQFSHNDKRLTAYFIYNEEKGLLKIITKKVFNIFGIK